MEPIFGCTAKTTPGECGCGVSDNADSDTDGVPDCIDQCPGIDDAIFAPECTVAIPAVSQWGVVVMALLLLVAIEIRYGIRRAPSNIA